MERRAVLLRAALRRTRLPFVASLFLAALLGAPTAPGPVADPLPAPAAAISAASSTVTTAAATVAVEPAASREPATTADDVPVATHPGGRTLADRIGTAVTGPRAPPRSA